MIDILGLLAGSQHKRYFSRRCLAKRWKWPRRTVHGTRFAETTHHPSSSRPKELASTKSSKMCSCKPSSWSKSTERSRSSWAIAELVSTWISRWTCLERLSWRMSVGNWGLLLAASRQGTIFSYLTRTWAWKQIQSSRSGGCMLAWCGFLCRLASPASPTSPASPKSRRSRKPRKARKP